MFISYFKGTPEYHIVRFRNGKIRGQGRGISFWYGTLGTTIAMVPVTSLDNPFIFTETTANFQDLAIQGSVSYRIVDPVKAAEGFDFSAKLNKSDVAGDGREKIAERLVLAIQSRARTVVSSMTLEQALAEVTKLGGNLAELLRSDPIASTAGLSIEEVHITSVQPTPEIRKALQTEYREALQRQADEAIYARRAYGVEKEREIKQSELATEIELAERNKLLVDTEARNKLTLAEAQAKAQQLELTVYSSAPASVLTAMAFKAWAEKGGSVGNLSITPDMLTSALGQLAAPAKTEK
ncbi:SPFH domain-containing protein [Mesorhizobium comanense]|uniref:SPFH domain-containing protein n=1 Tax=Mesorhizobium comanense TaxID=2502215 RepID=UPI0010F4EB04|nr:SPFH domain-containing protein [Mesorhizobium comanense]